MKRNVIQFMLILKLFGFYLLNQSVTWKFHNQSGFGYNKRIINSMDSEKKLILMRGLPGSGKSTLAKKLAGANGVVYSTDDFFMVKGEYVYDSSKIGEYHNRNLERTIEAMKKQIPTIVVDNTNVKLWEMKKYVLQAQKFGYGVEIKEADAPWAWDYKQCAKKNTHSVPEQTCKRMIDNYEKFENIDEIKNAKENFRRNKNKN